MCSRNQRPYSSSGARDFTEIHEPQPGHVSTLSPSGGGRCCTSLASYSKRQPHEQRRVFGFVLRGGSRIFMWCLQPPESAPRAVSNRASGG